MFANTSARPGSSLILRIGMSVNILKVSSANCFKISGSVEAAFFNKMSKAMILNLQATVD